MNLATIRSSRAPQASPARPLQVWPDWRLPALSRLFARQGGPAPHPAVLNLPGQHTLRLAAHAGCTVTCRQGRIWITEEGGADIELRSGESCTLRAPGLTVAQAMEPSSLLLRGVRRAPRVDPGRAPHGGRMVPA